jgi:hypothetical protein
MGNTDMEIWVHPSGNEVWRIPPGKAVPPTSVVSKPPAVHPDIEELQIYVTQYSKRHGDLIHDARNIESQRSTLSEQRYEQLRDDWDKVYYGFEDELNDILKEVIPDMDGVLTPEEQKEKASLIQHLRALQGFPLDVIDPDGIDE